MLTTARVSDADPGSRLQGLEVDDSAWLEVAVPGDLHRALVEAGRLPALDHGLNNGEAAWVEQREWWFRLRLDPLGEVGADERVVLRLNGIDTLATIWLDGELLGESANMFHPASFDVTALAKRSEASVLAVCVHPAQLPVSELRKAQYSFGWDFAPRRPGVGLWQPVELLRHQHAAIDAVGFRTLRLETAEAITVADLDVTRFTDAAISARVMLTDEDGEVVAGAVVEVDADQLTVALPVPDPQLWWTHDRGDQPLYELNVELLIGEDVIDATVRQVGIRTIELDESPDPDEPGTFFRFLLNGEPVAIKGANWVPADTALGAVPAERYEALVSASRGAHMNMLRVWGGGIYEDDLFFDACDRLGVLVWQDFMFAGASYREDDPDMVASIEAEARHQVARLRAHPSLALWCGNNEVELLAALLDWEDQTPAYDLFHHRLAAIVAEVDGATGYIHSSPSRGNAQHEGDRHAWLVWHGIDESLLSLPREQRGIAWVTDGRELDPDDPLAAEYVALASPHRYLEDRARFASEYGLCGLPTLETLTHWTDPDELHPDSPQIRARLTLGRLGPRNKFWLLLGALAGPVETLQDLVELSQLMQAEGNAVGVQHYRRRWPHCGGSMLWQLNDCWPSLSWSLIDYDGRPKAAYYSARRSFAPAILSFCPTAEGVELWALNDTGESLTDTVVVKHQDFSGDVRWSETINIAVESMPKRIASWTWEQLADRGETVLTAAASANAVARARHLLAPLPQLQRARPVIEHEMHLDGDVLEVTLRSDSFALMVHVVSLDVPLWFDDNYLDLIPGESRTITAIVPLGIDLKRLAVRWR